MGLIFYLFFWIFSEDAYYFLTVSINYYFNKLKYVTCYFNYLDNDLSTLIQSHNWQKNNFCKIKIALRV